MEGHLNLGEIEAALEEFSTVSSFSFLDTAKALMTGQLPFTLEEIGTLLKNLFIGEIQQQKNMAFSIFLIVFAAAVFASFVKIFEKSQIADISFYMMYLLIAALLVRSFRTMNLLVQNTCLDLNAFMNVLLPSYLITIVLSSGTVSAVGFYELTAAAINLVQLFLVKLILPAIHFYLILLLLDQMGKEDYFSAMAELVELVISWILKSILGIILGLQAVQCLVAPSVDALKNSAMHRLTKLMPGIGNALDTAAETVAGSAAVIKNAVGVTGMIALFLICAMPLAKLAVCILIFRLLCAVIQPFCEKRMVDGIASISRGTVLLLRVQMTALAVFLISLAMITAAVKGG